MGSVNPSTPNPAPAAKASTGPKAKQVATAHPLDTGIGKESRRRISDQLVQVLSDTYTLLVKTHVYHWNVVGPIFLPLHELTEKHYQDLFEAADTVAERIRALGHPTPLSFDEMLPKTIVDEETANRSAGGMVAYLVEDHEKLCKRIRTAAAEADEVQDFVTHDMLTARLNFHEKAIWMLRAIEST